MFIGTYIHLWYDMGSRRDGNLDLHTGFQANGSLRRIEIRMASMNNKSSPYDLLDDLARRVEVNKTLVNLEFVTVPGL